MMPLNLLLWQRLKSAFGEVKISNEGVAYQRADDGTPLSGGEQYRVCCPYCHDRKFHLYIAYTYGQRRDGRVCRRAHCFRRDCLASPAAALDLAQRLDGDPSLPLAEAPLAPATSPVVTPTHLPGWCVRLDMLPPQHTALRYLEQRQFDPLQLARTFGIGFCLQSDDRYCHQRIAIPIWQHEQYVGYQMRALPGQSGPKYYSAHGMPKSRLLYNLDSAQHYAFIVVVEGPSDVWRVGANAVATLGASASAWQLSTLAQLNLRAQIVWLYDANAAGQAGTARAQASWRPLLGAQPVHWLALPHDDPGSWSEADLTQWLQSQCPGYRVERLPAALSRRVRWRAEVEEAHVATGSD